MRGSRYCYRCNETVPRASRCPMCGCRAFYRNRNPHSQSIALLHEQPEHEQPETPPGIYADLPAIPARSGVAPGTLHTGRITRRGAQ